MRYLNQRGEPTEYSLKLVHRLQEPEITFNHADDVLSGIRCTGVVNCDFGVKYGPCAADYGVCPADYGVCGADCGARGADYGVCGADCGARGADYEQIVVSVEQIVVPVQQNTVPVQQNTVPVQQNTVPVQHIQYDIWSCHHIR